MILQHIKYNMSSPAHRRASSQAHPNGTPQPVRQHVASSSPLFYGSSQNGTPHRTANGGPNGAINGFPSETSSPLKQASMAGSTPRGRAPGGKFESPDSELLLTSTKKSPLQFTMPRVRVPQEPQLTIHLKELRFQVVVAACSSVRQGRNCQEPQD